MDSPSSYRILIKGCLNPRWSEWFDGLTITRTSEGGTMLTGRVLDQAELYGLLNKLRDLGLPLISVNSIEEPFMLDCADVLDCADILDCAESQQ